MALQTIISDLFQSDPCCCLFPGIQHCPFPDSLGAGAYHIVHLSPDAAIVLVDGVFYENFSYHIHGDDLLHIGYYQQIHAPHTCPHAGRPMGPDSFYAHIGLSGPHETAYRLHTPVKSVHIFLTPAYYDTLLSRKIPNAGRKIAEAVSILEQIEYFPELTFVFRQLYCYQPTGTGDLLFYESKLNEILARILQKGFHAPGHPVRPVKQADMDAAHTVAEYIRTHTSQDTPLSLLSHMACMSPAKLKYVFKSVFNCSIRDYRLQNRVHVAKELLYHTDLPIAEIASQLGYQNSGNFSALFKKYTGFLPKTFREQSRIYHETSIDSR